MYPPSSIDLLGIVDDQSLEHCNNVPEDSEWYVAGYVCQLHLSLGPLVNFLFFGLWKN
jgi:hypothetical protein